MPQENPERKELQRSQRSQRSEEFEEKERKTQPRKKAQKAQEEVGLSLATAGITQNLVEKATVKCAKKIEAKTFTELEQINPELVAVIKGVAEYFAVPAAILCAVFYSESNFKHGLIGDPHLKVPSVGIGQFREGTWNELMTEPAKEFVEFREFLSKFYPGKRFKRGENLLADIVATAALLKHLGGKRTDFNKLTEHRIIFLRARYVGDGDPKKQMALYLARKFDQVSPKYLQFLETYKAFAGKN